MFIELLTYKGGSYMFTELNGKLIEIKKKLREKSKLDKKLYEINKEILNEKEVFENLNIENLLNQKDDIEKELLCYSNVEDEFKEILKKKEELIKQSNSIDEENLKLMDLRERLADIEYDIREYGEAIDAGNDVLECIDKLMQILSSSKKIGFFKNLIRSDSLKEEDMERARELTCITRHSMNKFKRELLDVKLLTSKRGVITSSESFSKMIDLFINDFCVRADLNKDIDRAIFNGRSLSENIQVYVSELLESEKKVKEELLRLKENYSVIIENMD